MSALIPLPSVVLLFLQKFLFPAFLPMDKCQVSHKLEYNGGFSDFKRLLLIRDTVDVTREMWFKFRQALLTRYFPSYFQTLPHLYCLLLIWVDNTINIINYLQQLHYFIAFVSSSPYPIETNLKNLSCELNCNSMTNTSHR